MSLRRWNLFIFEALIVCTYFITESNKKRRRCMESNECEDVYGRDRVYVVSPRLTQQVFAVLTSYTGIGVVWMRAPIPAHSTHLVCAFTSFAIITTKRNRDGQGRAAAVQDVCAIFTIHLFILHLRKMYEAKYSQNEHQVLPSSFFFLFGQNERDKCSVLHTEYMSMYTLYLNA